MIKIPNLKFKDVTVAKVAAVAIVAAVVKVAAVREVAVVNLKVSQLHF